ncbi:hypothetical protein D3C71_1655330 [compost metagenome]
MSCQRRSCTRTLRTCGRDPGKAGADSASKGRAVVSLVSVRTGPSSIIDTAIPLRKPCLCSACTMSYTRTVAATAPMNRRSGVSAVGSNTGTRITMPARCSVSCNKSNGPDITVCPLSRL